MIRKLNFLTESSVADNRLLLRIRLAYCFSVRATETKLKEDNILETKRLKQNR